MNTNQQILTPCPPRTHCKVCEGRLTHIFGGAKAKDKTAKYRHQAGDNGNAAYLAILAGNVDKAYAMARRAASYAAMVLEAS